MCAYHQVYLAAQTVQGLKQLIKTEWGVDLSSAHAALEGVDTENGILTVAPCPFGFLATMEDQERLTGDSEDRDYVAQVSDENWERMKAALAELKSVAGRSSQPKD
jgi:hypothetical protein